LKDARAGHIFGISTQTPAYQQEVVARLDFPLALQSDAELMLRDVLDLPYFEADGMVLFHRLTLIVSDRKIEHVFDNIEKPTANKNAVLEYLSGR
jgi:peroxiredoxin